MGLTGDGGGKVAFLIIGAVVGAVLTVLGDLFVMQWDKADVRYGTSGVYIHSKLAIAVVGLKNWGRSDAENLTITASFSDPFTTFSADQITTPFVPTAGGDDKKSITGTIKSLAPGEVVNIYFITEPSSPWVDQKPVVRSVKFDGGLGKTGVPWLPEVGLFLAFVAGFGILILVVELLTKGQREAYYTRLREAIQLGLEAAREGVSQERFDARLEERYGKARQNKRALLTAAKSAFAWGGQGPSQTERPMN
jgi:hypothetical protein